MICSIGLDVETIARFDGWGTKPKSQLLCVLNEPEIKHCLRVVYKQAERFSGIFCAKEALYKALTPLVQVPIPLLTLCRAATVTSRPYAGIVLSEQFMACYLPNADKLVFFCSISHTKELASAVVIAQMGGK